MTAADCLARNDLRGLERLSNYSNGQIEFYCSLYDEFKKFDNIIDRLIAYSMAVTGSIGLINYVLTYLTFSDSSVFTGPSFLYHKVMALIQLVHMAIMCQYGILRVLRFPGATHTYSMIFWRDCTWGGWMIGDGAKSWVNTLATFATLERTIAVWLPHKFDAVNQNGVVGVAIVISVLIGSLHLVSLAAYQIVIIDDHFTIVLSEFGDSSTYANTQTAIYLTKIILGLCTLVMCVMITVGIYQANRRAAKMSRDVKARWERVKKGCYLLLIVAISTLIDHVAWVAYKVVGLQQPYPLVGREALMYVDEFDTVLENLRRSHKVLIFEIIQVFTTEIDHGGRFYFYLIFHTNFRESFKKYLFRVLPAVGGMKVVPLAAIQVVPLAESPGQTEGVAPRGQIVDKHGMCPVEIGPC